MDKIYVVVQCGVYRHDIVGASQYLDKAKRLAHEALELESDDYHRYEVIETTIGKLTPDKVVYTARPEPPKPKE